MSEIRLITALGDPPPSFARVQEPTRPPLRVGLVQHRWHPDPDEHRAALAEGVRLAAKRLQVHSNTAQYRLRRIEERSGRNPRRLSDLLDLLVAIALDDAA